MEESDVIWGAWESKVFVSPPLLRGGRGGGGEGVREGGREREKKRKLSRQRIHSAEMFRAPDRKEGKLMTVIALACIFVQMLKRDTRGGPRLSLLQGDGISDSPTSYPISEWSWLFRELLWLWRSTSELRQTPSFTPTGFSAICESRAFATMRRCCLCCLNAV